MSSASSAPDVIEWILPDVLPGICRLFLHVQMHPLVVPQQPTSWQSVYLDGGDLKLYSVKMALATRQDAYACLEAVFVDEPTLDQMDSLLDFACRLEKRGLPAIVSGRF